METTATHIEIKVTVGNNATYYTFTKDRKGNSAANKFLTGIEQERVNGEYEQAQNAFAEVDSKRWKLDKAVDKMLSKLSRFDKKVNMASDVVTSYSEMLNGDQVKEVSKRLQLTGQLNKAIDRQSLHMKKQKDYSAKCDAKIDEFNKYTTLSAERKEVLDKIPKPEAISIEINHIIKDSEYDKDLL